MGCVIRACDWISLTSFTFIYSLNASEISPMQININKINKKLSKRNLELLYVDIFW